MCIVCCDTKPYEEKYTQITGEWLHLNYVKMRYDNGKNIGKGLTMLHYSNMSRSLYAPVCFYMSLCKKR